MVVVHSKRARTHTSSRRACLQLELDEENVQDIAYDGGAPDSGIWREKKWIAQDKKKGRGGRGWYDGLVFRVHKRHKRRRRR